MKIALLLILMIHSGVAATQVPTQSITNADEAEQWWAEAKKLGQNVAALKKARYNAKEKISMRIQEEAVKKVQSEPNNNYSHIYEALRLQADPEFVAIAKEYDPQVTEANNQYVTFLQKGNLSNKEIFAAKMELRPAILYHEKAKYTEAARQNRVQGTVMVSMIFASDGQIKNPRIISGLPDEMNEEAIKAANEIVFLPALKNGDPVSVRMSVEFTFKLL